MRNEDRFIADIKDARSKTLVDLGAGYGRSLPLLAKVGHDVIAIEINPDMNVELERRALKYNNVQVIKGDFLKLPEILPTMSNRPVFLFLLNTLGTIEGGDYKDAVQVAMQEATNRQGELVLSLLRQHVLGSWGLEFYGKISEMTGNVNMKRSDFKKGILITNTGYTSKWWTDEDIEGFKRLGKLIREEFTDEYTFLQLGF